MRLCGGFIVGIRKGERNRRKRDYRLSICGRSTKIVRPRERNRRKRDYRLSVCEHSTKIVRPGERNRRKRDYRLSVCGCSTKIVRPRERKCRNRDYRLSVCGRSARRSPGRAKAVSSGRSSPLSQTFSENYSPRSPPKPVLSLPPSSSIRPKGEEDVRTSCDCRVRSSNSALVYCFICLSPFYQWLFCAARYASAASE